MRKICLFSKPHNFPKWRVKHFATSLKIWFRPSSFQWYYFQFEIRWRSSPNPTLKMSSCPISPMYSILEFSPHWGKHAFFQKTKIAIQCRILSATKFWFHLNFFFFANANPIPSFRIKRQPFTILHVKHRHLLPHLMYYAFKVSKQKRLPYKLMRTFTFTHTLTKVTSTIHHTFSAV